MPEDTEYKEAYFDEYCKTCCYEEMEENCDSCGECLENAVNLYSHKPTNWKAKEE